MKNDVWYTVRYVYNLDNMTARMDIIDQAGNLTTTGDFSLPTSSSYSYKGMMCYRTLCRTLRNDGSKVEVPEFNLNKNSFCYDLDVHLAMHKEWEKVYNREVFALGYHFWRALYFDISGEEMPGRLCEDMGVYDENNIRGMVQFASPRHFFPNGHMLYSHARNMFDRSVPMDEWKQEYFSCAYGEWAEDVLSFFRKAKEVFSYRYVVGESVEGEKKCFFNPAEAVKLRRAAQLSCDAKMLCEKMTGALCRVQAVSRKLLYYYGIYVGYIGGFLAEKAAGNNDKAKELFEKFKTEFGKLEIDIDAYYNHQMTVTHFSMIANNQEFGIQNKL